MSLFRRTPPDPALLAAQEEARRDAVRAEIERARLTAQLDRERREAEEVDRRRREELRRVEKAEARERNRKARAELAARLRPVLPLLLINGGAAYAQAAYAYEEIAPREWNIASKVAFAIAFALALESIAVYVQWHAHDALLLKAHATAAGLRRASWVIAGVVGAINYAHFADGAKPTSAAVAFALLSLLSPWLWGLHTRRVQHVQLLAEDASLIDEGGVEFSQQRRRAFPIRSWLAKRWSIDHYERDPKAAWEGYNAERAARKATKEKPATDKHAVAAPAPAAVDDLTAIVDATSPTVEEQIEAAIDRHLTAVPPQPSPAVHRPRWRTVGPRRPRRMGRAAPAINVTVVAPERPTRTASPAADGGRSKPAPKAAKPPATTADRVAALLKQKPAMTQADVAARLQLGERTVRRYWPRQMAGAVNGHDHSQEG